MYSLWQSDCWNDFQENNKHQGNQVDGSATIGMTTIAEGMSRFSLIPDAKIQNKLSTGDDSCIALCFVIRLRMLKKMCGSLILEAQTT